VSKKPQPKAAPKQKVKKVRAGPIIATIKRGVGRPAYDPDDDERALVMRLARVGLRQAEIANLVGVDETTLRKHFGVELETAHGKAVAEALDKGLLQQAIAGNVTAAIFIAKTRAGWREQPTQLEIEEKGGAVEDKKALVARVMALIEDKRAAEPTTIDVTPTKEGKP
jgi:hypothetical protein